MKEDAVQSMQVFKRPWIYKINGAGFVILCGIKNDCDYMGFRPPM